MNLDRFDELSRRVATAGSLDGSRRNLLKWFAGGTAAIAAGSSAMFGRGGHTAAQESDVRRAAGKSDIGKLAFDLQYDANQIYAWVRDNIRYEPYSGVLRGAQGALWGKSANSVDQALLLQALLSESMVTSRLVRGALSDDAAARKMSSALLDLDGYRAEVERIGGGASLDTSELPAAAASPEAATVAQDLVARADELRPELVAAVRSQMAFSHSLIADQLTAVGITLSELAAALPNREREDHVWVQIQQGTEWVDLDPTWIDNGPGDVLAESGEVVEAIAEDLFHTVTIRLMGDMVRGGSVVQEELLTYTGRSADLVGVPLSFLHAKPQSMGIAINEALGGTDQYQPLLQVGEVVTQGVGFAFNGQGGAIDVLGDGSSSREGEPVSEWLEFTITSPDQDDIVEIRNILDRVGADARDAGRFDEAVAELGPIETIPVDETVGEVYVPLLNLYSIGCVSAPVPSQYFAQDWSVADSAGDLANQNHVYHYLRDQMAAEIADVTGLRFVRDRPSVTMIEMGLVGEPDAFSTSVGFDLVSSSQRPLALTGANASDLASVVDGVLAQVCERNLFEFGKRAAPESLDIDFVSVGRIFETATDAGIGIQTIQPGTSMGSDLASALSASARLEINSLLESGYAVIVPESPVTMGGRGWSGFWAVHPGTGRTIDRLENGRGSTLPEEATLLDVVIHVIHHFQVLATCIIGVGAAAACLLIMAGSGYSDGLLAGAVAGAVHGGAFCAAAAA